MNGRFGLTRYRREFIICPLELAWALTGTAFTSSSIFTPHSLLLGFIEPDKSRRDGTSQGDRGTRRNSASPGWLLFDDPVRPRCRGDEGGAARGGRLHAPDTSYPPWAQPGSRDGEQEQEQYRP